MLYNQTIITFLIFNDFVKVFNKSYKTNNVIILVDRCITNNVTLADI